MIWIIHRQVPKNAKNFPDTVTNSYCSFSNGYLGGLGVSWRLGDKEA